MSTRIDLKDHGHVSSEIDLIVSVELIFMEVIE